MIFMHCIILENSIVVWVRRARVAAASFPWAYVLDLLVKSEGLLSDPSLSPLPARDRAMGEISVFERGHPSKISRRHGLEHAF
jgi:hypothetical protein